MIAQAQSAAREDALEFTDARMQTLVACAREVETYVGRALWPGTRAALSIVEVSDPYETVSLVPGLPNTSGVTLGDPRTPTTGPFFGVNRHLSPVRDGHLRGSPAA